MTGWVGDLRFVIRSLRRSPGFTALVAVTLALGIGGSGAVFGVAERTLFTPPPFERPEQLVFVWNTVGDSDERLRVPAPDVAEIRARVPSLAAAAFIDRVTDGAVESLDASVARHVRIASVSPNLFDILGVAPPLGRGFLPTDVGPGAGADGPGSPVAVLSHDAWTGLFGTDPAIVGRTLRLDGRAVTVLGVLPAAFRLAMPPGTGVASDADVWTPLPVPLDAFQRGDGRRVDQDSDNTGAVIGRLAAGATLPRVQADLDRLVLTMRSEIPGYAASGMALVARPLHDDQTRHARGILAALIGAVAVVLLVTCLNVSAMVLERGVRRADEIALKAALGAGRVRILRSLATESMVLVALGAGLAVAVALGISQLLQQRAPAAIGLDQATPDRGVLLAAPAVAALVMVLLGLVPAARTALFERSGRVAWAMRPGRRSRSTGRRVLIVGQVALSVALVFAASLLLRTVQELRSVETGFSADQAITFSLSLRVPGRYRGPADRAELVALITSRLGAMPGVRSVGLTTHLPLSGRRWTQPYGLPGQPSTEWSENRADFRAATSGMFDAMGFTLVEGRTFTTDEDVREERRVVVIDEALARRIAPESSAVGRTIGIPLDGAEVEARVVGVVGQVRYDGLEEAGRGAIYVPYRQEASRDVSFVVRSTGEPAPLAPAIRSTVARIDPQLAVYALRPLERYLADAVAPARFTLDVLGFFALLTFVAVAIGVYGVVGFEVAGRRREIGLRLAVGASRHGVVASAAATGLRLVGMGSALGMVLSVPVVWALGSSLYGTGITDPKVWAGVGAAVALFVVGACWVPARRAAALDPTVALRSE